MNMIDIHMHVSCTRWHKNGPAAADSCEICHIFNEVMYQCNDL